MMLMELDDLVLDGSWALDHIAFAPAVFSSLEHPCSPLWMFSEAAPASGDGGELCSPSSAASGTPSSGSETAVENRDNGKIPSPLWRMMPLENPDSYCAIKARMTQALRYFKELTGQQHVLVQVWAPVKNHGRYVLATSGQPFVLDPNSNGLNQYRMVSLMYVFSVDSETEGELGLPGRVYRKGLPEWSPNVQYYSSKEFSRLVHALQYNIQGTLALPVFEPSMQVCLGVVELIMTSQKINYAPVVEKVCKALEAVNLKTSEILNNDTTQICNEGRQNALAEILEIQTVVCETYDLPLAQTWVPCRHQSVLTYGGGIKKRCSSFDGSCMGSVCMSTSDLAFYVVDAPMWGFREACVEHHLQGGQGVAGRALVSGSLCFCRDVTQFCKSEYPLVHYARMFKLSSCFAICLQSSHTGYDEYVLELFLPPTITDKGEQDCLLGSLLATMRQRFRSLKVTSGVELCEDEAYVEISQASEDGILYSRLEPIRIHCLEKLAPRSNASLDKDDPQLNSTEKKLLVNSGPMDDKVDAMESKDIAGYLGRCNAPSPLPDVKSIKKLDRKRGKSEKSISLKVLQQYFAGSLKDAAKSLGVCATTMKRICRQHGISRWPSRKINKVNRSLTKLKHVLDSVQGADGAFDLTSLSLTPLPAVTRSISWAPNLNALISPALKPHESQPTEKSSPTCTSPRSCFQDVKIENFDGSGSGEDTADSSASQGSCEGNPFHSRETPVAVPTQEQSFTVNHPSETRFQLPILPPDPQETFGRVLVEDLGSPKDPSKLSSRPTCDSTSLRETISAYPTTLHMKDNLETLKPMITIKATYREDIIRFKISPKSRVAELKQEVAKRLKLDMGTFNLKCLIDDNEWVWVLCDADLRECIDRPTSSGFSTFRLSIHDVMSNSGSSCESTEEL